MKKIILILTVTLCISTLYNCEKNDDTPAISSINYVGFESGFTVGVDPNGTLAQEITIATSKTSSVDRTFNISVDTDLTTADASAYSAPSSVTVPAKSNIGTFNVDVIGANINTSGDDILGLAITSSDGLLVSDPISIGLEQVCPTPETFLDITFDLYSGETSWELLDASNTIIFSGSYVDGQTDDSTKFCLSNGTYTFVIYDVYADGICCNYGDGSYILTNNGNVIKEGGSFGSSESTTFTLNN